MHNIVWSLSCNINKKRNIFKIFCIILYPGDWSHIVISKRFCSTHLLLTVYEAQPRHQYHIRRCCWNRHHLVALEDFRFRFHSCFRTTSGLHHHSLVGSRRSLPTALTVDSLYAPHFRNSVVLKEMGLSSTVVESQICFNKTGERHNGRQKHFQYLQSLV